MARDEETLTHSAGCTGKESRERKNARHRGDMDVRWRAKSRRHALGAGCKRAWWQQAWVLAARVGAGCKHVVLDSRKVVGVALI